MKLEDLRVGAGVVSRDGHKLGSLSRFVVTQDASKLTHIVIDTGILRSGEPLWKGGWGLSYDRVLPLAALERATSDEVRITMTAEEFREHSRDYIEEHFHAMPDFAPGRPDTSDIARLAASIPGEPGTYMVHEVMAHAPGEADIRKDAAVWRLNPHQKIGEVERVVFEADGGRVRSLVIRRGFLFTKDIELPVEHVVEIVGEVVRVDIDDATLKSLPEYHAPD
jgi:sporulation protein YlmC with PRC-barrel domain